MGGAQWRRDWGREFPRRKIGCHPDPREFGRSRVGASVDGCHVDGVAGNALTLNAGAVALAATGRSTRDLARLFHKSHEAVRRWRSALSVPDADARAVLRRELGIDESAWDTIGATGATAATSTDTLTPATARERLEQQIERLRVARADPTASPRSRLDLEKLELQASRALAELEGAVLTERQILASGVWVRVRETVVTALEPWPDAMRAVADALERAEAEAQR